MINNKSYIPTGNKILVLLGEGVLQVYIHLCCLLILVKRIYREFSNHRAS